MIHQHNLPYSPWKKAVAYATYVKNRSPTCAIKDHKVPDNVFWGKKPNVSNLEEFGKTCWVLQQHGKSFKLDLESRQFIFVGVADGTKGYRYYSTSTHQILTSQNVVFEVEGEKSHDVEITHPMPLEGESEENDKQPSGGEGIQAQNTPEKEMHHASKTPSKIPVPWE